MILHKMEKIRLQIEDFFNTADIRNNKKDELALLCALVKSSLQDGNLGDQNHTLQALRFMALNRPEQTRHNTGNFLWELEKTLRTDLQCFSREKGADLAEFQGNLAALCKRSNKITSPKQSRAITPVRIAFAQATLGMRYPALQEKHPLMQAAQNISRRVEKLSHRFHLHRAGTSLDKVDLYQGLELSLR